MVVLFEVRLLLRFQQVLWNFYSITETAVDCSSSGLQLKSIKAGNLHGNDILGVCHLL